MYFGQRRKNTNHRAWKTNCVASRERNDCRSDNVLTSSPIKNKQSAAGFTFIEVFVVVILISILAAIVIPRFLVNKRKAQVASCEMNRNVINKQVDLFYMTQDTWPLDSLDDIRTNVSYFPDGIPTCPVDYTSYILTPSPIHRVSGHRAGDNTHVAEGYGVGSNAAVLFSAMSFGLPGNQIGYFAQQTSSGGYIVTGAVQNGAGWDGMVVKTDVNGNVLWTVSLSEIGSTDNEFYHVQETADGGFVLSGSTGNAGGSAAWLVKLDSNGNTIFHQTYGGLGFDNAFTVQQTPDGGYIVAGNLSFPAQTAWMMKTDSAGNTTWSNTYGGIITGAVFKDVIRTTDGGFVAVGEKDNTAFMVKTDAAGNTLWQPAFGLPNQEANSVKQTADGGYIVFGYTDSAGAGGDDYWAMKTDSNGNSQWTRTYGGAGTDTGKYVVTAPDNGFYMIGTSDSFGAGTQGYLVRTDSNGAMLWTKLYGNVGDTVSSISPSAGGGFVISGTTSANQAWALNVGANGECTGYGCP